MMFESHDNCPMRTLAKEEWTVFVSWRDAVHLTRGEAAQRCHIVTPPVGWTTRCLLHLESVKKSPGHLVAGLHPRVTSIT